MTTTQTLPTLADLTHAERYALVDNDVECDGWLIARLVYVDNYVAVVADEDGGRHVFDPAVVRPTEN